MLCFDLNRILTCFPYKQMISSYTPLTLRMREYTQSITKFRQEKTKKKQTIFPADLDLPYTALSVGICFKMKKKYK